MISNKCLAAGFTVLLAIVSLTGCSTHDSAFPRRLTDWKIAPSTAAVTPDLKAIAVTAADDEVATAHFPTGKWLKATVPGTVLGNLVDNGVYNNLFEPDNDGKINEYFHDNLSRIPTEDFDHPWWYSTEFTIPANASGKRITLTFKGISYTGEIYVNGTKVSNTYINITEEDYLKNGPTMIQQDAEITDFTISGAGSLRDVRDFEAYKTQFIGTMRTYDIDITDLVTVGKTVNNVKVKITKPVYQQDLTYYWVDWNPQPADAMMGLTGEVFLHTSGSARLANPAVASKVDYDHQNAQLNFFVDVSNFTKEAVNGTLTAVVKDPGGHAVATVTKENINIPADAYNHEIELRASDFPQLKLVRPKLWWPYLSGDQPLYTVDYEFTVGGEVSDRLHHRFGIREITEAVNVSPIANHFGDSISATHLSNMLQIYVNHRPVLLKGGGYCASDLLLRHNKRTNKAIVDYIKYMGMNMIRDEGKFFDNDLLALMDEAGIMLMTGWCCCDRWQEPGQFSKAERFVAFESLYAQLRNARRFACMMLWFNGSDDPPSIARQGVNGQNVEQKYFEIEANLRWLEIGANCNNGSAKLATLTGIVGGMHMDATYDSQTPTWYYAETKGNFGFISEGGGGGSIPVQETMRRMLPEANLWPYNSAANYNVWNFHTCRGGFNNLGQHVSFIDGSYGASRTFDEFITRAQVFQYDIQRAQYEALNYYRYKNTSGFVNWMLNNAWPVMFWNQFDYYMNPNGTTYGARKGNEPVHIMYSMYYKNISVINNTLSDYPGAVATLSIFDINGKPISTNLEKKIDIKADGASKPVEYAAAGNNRSGPQPVGLIKNSSGTYEPYMINYYGKINEAYGVTDLWSYEDIQASLTKPASDVYFIRLELKDATGKTLSVNTYAEPLRNDVAGASHAWNRSGVYQVSDMTQLNQLQAVDLELSQVAFTQKDYENELTCRVTNPTDRIAYAVELKAYTGSNKKTLVAPVLYDDNLFTLLPGETRIINIIYNRADLESNAVVTVTCYNNSIRGSNARAATSIYTGVPVGGSRNLALAKRVTGGVNPENITIVTEGGQTNAVNGKTFIDADVSTFATLTPEEGSFVVDLDSVKRFDRIMLRWNRTFERRNVHNLRGRPDRVKIEVSDDNLNYKMIADEDNSTMGSTMTNIILPEQAGGRYVKITPSGLLSASPSVGMNSALSAGGVSGQSVSGIAEAPASTAFTLSAIEIYVFE
ncbi:MAG: discoidin domain-containing protein [Tannerella sp.]|jgi:exo-1,4-beta-D-glucosaminidase|nr:discoidin domain-containing protein [Tannerella sp.]